MTRPEMTGERDLTFSGWIRENLPDSNTGFVVSDLDFIIWNYKTRRMMMIEVKTHSAKMRTWQERLFRTLDEVIKVGAERIEPPIEYRGFHCVRFEGTCFADGRCVLDSSLVTEEELIQYLSMNN